jgi:hypothetical protein
MEMTGPGGNGARPPTPNGDGYPIVVPLTDPRCADSAFAGDEVAALALVDELLPVPPTVVAVGPVVGWRQGGPDGTAAVALTERARLARHLDGPVTVQAWVIPDDGSARRLAPVWYNIHPSALDECVLELVGLAGRAATAPGPTRLAALLQAFVPADVTVLATVDSRHGSVRLRSCLGIAEDLGAGLWQDELVLTGPDLAVHETRVIHKPTATAAAAGGTHVVDIAPERRGRPALPVPQARELARTCRAAAGSLGRPAEFEVAIRDGVPLLLSCRTPAG